MGGARAGLGRRLLMGAGLLLACGMTDVTAAEKRIALVIGNGNYDHVPKLPNAVNDAHAMAQELGLSLHGFKVIYDHDLPRASMWSRINDFIDAARRYDVALFYFAGHGVQINNTNWLVPTDIPNDLQRGADVQAQSVSMGDVADMMAEANPRGVNMLIIDACRDNPFAGNGQNTGAARGLATMAGANGDIFLYSAGSGQTALDGLTPNDLHGLFTRELLTAMRQPGVPVSMMMTGLQATVRRLAETVHHLQTPAYYAERGSNFMFTPLESALPGAARPADDARIAIVPPVPADTLPGPAKSDGNSKAQMVAKSSGSGIARPTPPPHGHKDRNGSNDPDKTCTSLGTC
jgi:Caspase domain